MHFSFLSQTLLLTLFSSLLFAQTPKSKPTQPQTQTVKRQTQPSRPKEVPSSHLEIGATYSYAWINPHSFPHTRGNLGGAQGIFEYRPVDSVYFALALSWKQGNTSGKHLDHFLLDIDSQERLGFSYFASNNMTRFSLFTGFGYRYLGEKRTLSGMSVKYNYNHFYIPVGFTTDIQVDPMLSLGLNIQWKPQVFPTVTIVPLDGGAWNIKKQLANFLIETPISLLFQEEQLSLKFVPFFEVWKDGRTTAKTDEGVALTVPKLKYSFVGITVNLEYSL